MPLSGRLSHCAAGAGRSYKSRSKGNGDTCPDNRPGNQRRHSGRCTWRGRMKCPAPFARVWMQAPDHPRSPGNPAEARASRFLWGGLSRMAKEALDHDKKKRDGEDRGEIVAHGWVELQGPRRSSCGAGRVGRGIPLIRWSSARTTWRGRGRSALMSRPRLKTMWVRPSVKLGRMPPPLVLATWVPPASR